MVQALRAKAGAPAWRRHLGQRGSAAQREWTRVSGERRGRPSAAQREWTRVSEERRERPSAAKRGWAAQARAVQRRGTGRAARRRGTKRPIVRARFAARRRKPASPLRASPSAKDHRTEASVFATTRASHVAGIAIRARVPGVRGVERPLPAKAEALSSFHPSSFHLGRRLRFRLHLCLPSRRPAPATRSPVVVCANLWSRSRVEVLGEVLMPEVSSALFCPRLVEMNRTKPRG